ncbi:MAG: hypothetical protein A2033_15375 [Bacteroidetes bacterium GWA2_31_9]|nr:MAG: hypothetical protein A2033_15375 [Bacteroidetes bacterium GWA2_31_9]
MIMRKFTLLIAICFSVYAFGQTKMPISANQIPCKPEKIDAPKTNEQIAMDKNIQAIFWSENFNSGTLPTGWSMVDLAVDAYDFNWIVSNAAPGGQYSTSVTPILSTSAGYFMSLRADFYNTPFPGGTPVNMDAYFQTAAIDCSSKATVLLSFQQYFRYCCSASAVFFSVFVSNDGTNWTEYDVKEGQAVNSATANPINTDVDISATAANQSTVYLRWHMYGGSHYFWMVDDIQLSSLPVNDVQLVQAWPVFDGAGFYSKTPLTQLQNVNFGANVLNFGTDAQTNVNLNVVVNNYSSDVFNENGTAIPSVAPSTADTVPLAVPFTLPNDVRTYHATYHVFSDQTDEVPANNDDTISFSVSDTVFARDYIRTTTAGPCRYVGPADGDAAGTVFYMINGDEANSISVYVTSNSTVGTSFIGKIWMSDGAGGWTDVAVTDIRDIVTEDLGTWVTVPILKDGSAEFLQAATWYNVGIEIYGISDGTSKLYVGGDDLGPHDFPNSSALKFQGAWYYDDVLPTIRLNIVNSSIPLSCYISSKTDVSCNGQTNGSADLAVTGGLSPYDYLWSSGETISSISGQAAGTYTVTVTDAFSDQCFATVSITEPVAILVSHLMNGADVDVTVIGGTQPYTYLWNTGSINQDLTGVASNTFYSLTVTDYNGCTYQHDFTTAINSMSNKVINVYPNPTKGVLNIENAENSSIKVYNIIGNVVASVNNASTLTTIDISNLAEGSYIVKILSDKKSVVKKINLIK